MLAAFQWARLGLNQRPYAHRAHTLTTELHARVGGVGFEPTTSRSLDAHSTAELPARIGESREYINIFHKSPYCL